MTQYSVQLRYRVFAKGYGLLLLLKILVELLAKR